MEFVGNVWFLLMRPFLKRGVIFQKSTWERPFKFQNEKFSFLWKKYLNAAFSKERFSVQKKYISEACCILYFEKEGFFSFLFLKKYTSQSAKCINTTISCISPIATTDGFRLVFPVSHLEEILSFWKISSPCSNCGCLWIVLCLFWEQFMQIFWGRLVHWPQLGQWIDAWPTQFSDVIVPV